MSEPANSCAPKRSLAHYVKPARAAIDTPNKEAVLSEVLAEATLGFSVPRSSVTICTDCDAAAISFVCDGELLLFRSLCTVAKAD